MLVLNITREMEMPFSWQPVFLTTELGNDTASAVINSSMCRERSERKESVYTGKMCQAEQRSSRVI